MQARTHRSKTCPRPPAEEAEGGPGTEAGGGEEGGGGEEAEEAGGEGVPPWWLRHGVGAGRIIARQFCFLWHLLSLPRTMNYVFCRE